jgi:hypothetical protein
MRYPSRAVRETTWMARMESPPSAKKLSWTPISSRPSTPAQTRASAASAWVDGRARSSAARDSAAGAGRARRSTLPLGVSGMAAIGTMTDGTMCAGSSPARYSRSAFASIATHPSEPADPDKLYDSDSAPGAVDPANPDDAPAPIDAADPAELYDSDGAPGAVDPANPEELYDSDGAPDAVDPADPAELYDADSAAGTT